MCELRNVKVKAGSREDFSSGRLHLHGTLPRRRYHYPPLRCHAPPQSPCRTHRHTRSYNHI